jgi:hypothetical protein
MPIPPLDRAEGGAIPVVQSGLGSTTVGPTRKMAFIVPLTRELNEAVPETGAVILGRLLSESAALSLDAHVFDNVAADPTRPAGLLYGVSGLTPATPGTIGVDTIASDIGTMAQAFSDARVNPTNMVLICAPREATKLLLTRGYQTLPFTVLVSPALTSGTVIACVPEAIASGYSGDPEIDLTKNATLHYEDTSPLPIVGTSPATVANPVHSTFQDDSLAVRCKVRCCWASCQPGAVQYMTGVQW